MIQKLPQTKVVATDCDEDDGTEGNVSCGCLGLGLDNHNPRMSNPNPCLTLTLGLDILSECLC